MLDIQSVSEAKQELMLANNGYLWKSCMTDRSIRVFRSLMQRVNLKSDCEKVYETPNTFTRGFAVDNIKWEKEME